MLHGFVDPYHDLKFPPLVYFTNSFSISRSAGTPFLIKCITNRNSCLKTPQTGHYTQRNNQYYWSYTHRMLQKRTG